MVGLLWHWELQDFHNNDVVITTIDLGISYEHRGYEHRGYEHHGFNYKEQIHPDLKNFFGTSTWWKLMKVVMALIKIQCMEFGWATSSETQSQIEFQELATAWY